VNGQEDVIRRITSHIVAYRFQLENERNSRMAIEIKGLKLQAMTARGHLDRLSQAYAKFNEAAPAHAADVEGMAEQIGEMQSDLEFATNVMGNSAGESGKLAQTPSEKPVSTSRVALGPHPDQPSKLEADAAAAGFDPHVYRAFEAGLPLEAAKAVNGS
jgi:hypothetical protein